MSKIYLIDYKNDLVSFSRKAKGQADDTFSYYKKVFSYLKAVNSNKGAVYEECITGASGYDHCDRLWGSLDLLACDDFDNVYRVLPEGLPLSTNGYPMYIHGTNILLCLLYNSENAAVYPADKIIEKAEKFTASKKALWERAVISCLLGILQCDVTRISDSLQTACEGFAKTDAAKYRKMQCQNVYGLLMLAKHFLPEEKFAQIIYPEHKNFSEGYMSWLLKQDKLPNELCVTYDSPMEELNELLKKPIAITYIHQPYLNSDNQFLSPKEKKAYYMDLGKMLEVFINRG